MTIGKREIMRTIWDYDFGWKFYLGDVNGAQERDFDDTHWRSLDLPHDWSIEEERSPDNPSGVTGGYFLCGIGWYRKSLALSDEHVDRKVFIEFDGVYMNSDVWINGHHLGHRGYGYIGFQYDLTPYLRSDGENIVAARVDNSHQPHDRWYAGSGIHRHVRLVCVEDLHVAHWGTYITTPQVTQDSAKVVIRTQIANDDDQSRQFDLVTKVLDQAGNIVGTARESAGSEVEQEIEIPNPNLWELANPYLYRAISEIIADEKIVDTYETTFGIRTVEFTPEKGFLLNGRKVVMKGVCIHHDAGCLGAAVPDRAWERSLGILKGMGCNALRLSHNPYSPVVLDLCDRMGILVYDECFDKWRCYKDRETGEVYWDFFQTWRKNLHDFIIRDRNHPSVVIWSMGNEVPQQTGDPQGGVDIFKELMDYTHQMDPTRKVTCGLRPARDRIRGEDPTDPPPMAHTMDVVSYNYQTQTHGIDHFRYPNLIIIDSETYPWYTGDILRISSEQHILINSMLTMQDYIVGQFIWAGIDYLGEVKGPWPLKGWAKGLIDTCGFRKSASYYTQSFYSEEPMLHITVMDKSVEDVPGKFQWGWPPMASHWNWPDDKALKVVAFSNCESVELFLNGRSMGERLAEDFHDRIMIWRLPFEPGALKAFAKNAGEIVAEYELHTAGQPAKLVISADRSELMANDQDLSYLTVMVTDEAGTVVPNAQNLIEFEIDGPGRIIGVDNGDLQSLESYRASYREARNGKCLAIIQSNRVPGEISLIAKSSGLRSQQIKIQTKLGE